MIGYKYVISLYMSKHSEKINLQEMLNFSTNIADMYNVTYNEIGFSYMDGKKENTKTLKYTPKNINKLYLVDAKNITGLSFDQYKDEIQYNDPKFRMSFFIPIYDNHYPEYPNQFSMIIDKDQIDREFTCDDLCKLVSSLSKLGFNVEYGVAFTIETKKEPNYFIMGVITPNLTAEEREIAKSLALNIREYKNKIWDIFWFNIIKKELISGKILNNIMKILPSESILDEGDKYIISLPLTSDEYVNYKEKLSMYREKLRQIFRENDLIMYTGQHFPHYV